MKFTDTTYRETWNSFIQHEAGEVPVTSFKYVMLKLLSVHAHTQAATKAWIPLDSIGEADIFPHAAMLPTYN